MNRKEKRYYWYSLYEKIKSKQIIGKGKYKYKIIRIVYDSNKISIIKIKQN